MKWLIIVLLIGGGLDAAGQSGSRPVKEHTLVAGMTAVRLNDPLLISSPANGNTSGISYSFSKQTAAIKQTITASWSRGSLSNEQGNTAINQFLLRYARGFSLLKSSNGRFRSYWGYSMHTNPVFLKTASPDEALYSWSTVNDLSLYQSAVYTTGKTQLILDIYVPIAGLSSRPLPESRGQHSGNGILYESYNKLFFTSWHNRRSITAGLELRQALNERVDAVLGGRFAYYSLETGDTYPSYREKNIGLSAGVSWRLR